MLRAALLAAAAVGTARGQAVTAAPTLVPLPAPTSVPTVSLQPSPVPTPAPSEVPTLVPTSVPTFAPTLGVPYSAVWTETSIRDDCLYPVHRVIKALPRFDQGQQEETLERCHVELNLAGGCEKLDSTCAHNCKTPLYRAQECAENRYEPYDGSVDDDRNGTAAFKTYEFVFDELAKCNELTWKRILPQLASQSDSYSKPLETWEWDDRVRFGFDEGPAHKRAIGGECAELSGQFAPGPGKRQLYARADCARRNHPVKNVYTDPECRDPTAWVRVIEPIGCEMYGTNWETGKPLTWHTDGTPAHGHNNPRYRYSMLACYRDEEMEEGDWDAAAGRRGVGVWAVAGAALAAVLAGRR